MTATEMIQRYNLYLSEGRAKIAAIEGLKELEAALETARNM